MAVILTCPKCGHEFNSNTLNIKDPSEYQNVGTREICPKCGITSTYDSSMFRVEVGIVNSFQMVLYPTG